jgi:carbohydrate diacid regulator
MTAHRLTDLSDIQVAPATLTPELAQQIAGETSAIVGYNILITDPDGTVIGSGDTSRVGTFHEASLEVVGTGRPATHSAAQARALQGVRPGVTLPIVHNDRVVGTVGITGTPKQVTRFGMMVERQTEILLNESLILRSRLIRERVVEELVRDLLSFDPGLGEAEVLLDRAVEQGIDLSAHRVIHVVDVLWTAGSGSSDNLLPGALRLLRELFSNPQSVSVSVSAGRYVVLAVSEPSREAEAVRLAREVVARFSQRWGVDVAVGIGPSANGLESLRASYEDALDAARLGAPTSPDRVALSRSVRVPQLVNAVGHRARVRYIEAVTGELRNHPEWPTLRDTVIAWCESGFSLVRAADLLHVHRNTLIYRLDKIQRAQGWESRVGQEVLAMYLACVGDRLSGT